MAYETGTATSMSDLRSKIFTFLTTNSWTQEGTNILKKSGVCAHLEAKNLTVAETGETRQVLALTGGKKSDGSGNLLYPPVGPKGETLKNAENHISSILRGNVAGDLEKSPAHWLRLSWPITYYLHVFTTPDEFWCVIEDDSGYCQHLAFGNLVKVTNYSGGAFYRASFSEGGDADQGGDWTTLGEVWSTQNPTGTNDSGGGGGGSSAIIPFQSVDTFSVVEDSTGWAVHAEVGGVSWVTGARYTLDNTSKRSMTDDRQYLEERSAALNSFNGNATLIPFKLSTVVDSGNIQKLGYVNNCRFASIELMEIGQVESDGTDDWKFYPVFKKNTEWETNWVSRVEDSRGKSSVFGIAIRYDGP